MRLALLMLAGALLSAAPRARAQNPTAAPTPTPDSQRVKLTLRDGSVLIGRVIEVTPTSVRFLSAVGESTIPRDAIRTISPMSASSAHDGEYWPEDPSRTRLFFAPTGRMQREGEIYFSDAYIIFPSFQAGLTNHFSLGAGMSVVPGVSIGDQVFYVTPKVGLYASPKVNVAAGALVAGASSFTDEGVFGIGYGVATFGGEDGSVTTGAGFGFQGSNASPIILMLGGSKRVTPNIALISENYLYTGRGSNTLISAGFRFMSERIAFDLAGFAVGDGEVPVLPYAAFIYRF